MDARHARIMAAIPTYDAHECEAEMRRTERLYQIGAAFGGDARALGRLRERQRAAYARLDQLMQPRSRYARAG